MPMDNEELARRRQEREELRRQRQQQNRITLLTIGAAMVVVILVILLIVLLSTGSGSAPEVEATQPGESPELSDTPIGVAPETTPLGVAPETTPNVTIPEETTSRLHQDPTTVVHIRAAGDLNITDTVVNAGFTQNGYNFTAAFQDVLPVLADADLTVMNFEGNVCGAPFGTASASAPMELLYALRSAGVDILQTANSFTVHNGLLGMQSTLNNIRSVGIETTGSYANSQEFQNSQGYIMCEIQGIRIAIVAFTKGMGSRGIPTMSEDCVNLLYEDYATTYQKIDRDRIREILGNVDSEDPDLTIALLHWGSEFNDRINASQESIVSLMQDEGVDVIIGTHPHRVQKVDFNQETGTLVAYSLGDFFGDAKESGTNYSIILDLEITRDNETGKTKVTGFDYIPIYTLKESESCDGQRRVVRIQEAMLAYDTNFVDRITKEAYDSMKYSLERIEARVKGE